jgi:hypothetical protein
VRTPWMNVTKSSVDHTVGTHVAPIGSSKETWPFTVCLASQVA